MREKLIKLIRQCYSKHQNATDSRLADFLIDNGVTIPVRCKDCKHWNEDQYGCVCELHSEKEDEDYPAFGVQMLPDDFCSYGERKDNG